MMTRFPSRKRNTHRWLGVGLTLTVLALAAQAPAEAAQTTFAQFTQAGTATPFSFTDNMTFANLAISGVTTQVNFNFTSGSGLSTATHAATLTLEAITNTPATSATLGGTTYDSQPINGSGNPMSDVLTIVDNSTGKTLLTLTFNGNILGQQGTQQATLSGNSDPAVGNSVTYSSQFLNFDNSQPNSYQVGLTGLTAPLSIGPGGFLNSTLASFTGAFSATSFTPITAVPEPASLAIFGTGILSVLMLSTRRRSLGALFRS